jgi:predicted Zn-ribbon and HTH transcriptional regulator
MHKVLRKTRSKAAGPIDRSRRRQSNVNAINRNEPGGFFLPTQREDATSYQRNHPTNESYLVGNSLVINQQTCVRCGFKWFPRTQKLPSYCANPQCRSPYWNKSRVRQLPKSLQQKRYRPENRKE